MNKPILALLFFVLGTPLLMGDPLDAGAMEKRRLIQCANLTYAKSQTSVCFSDHFLKQVNKKTYLQTVDRFSSVKLASKELFDFPFAVMSGTGDFRLTQKEREILERYLLNGGFILASPGCSDPKWAKAFRREILATFKDTGFEKLPMDHPIFSFVNHIPKMTLKNGGSTLVEGLKVGGRVAVIFSAEGLNDVGNAKGCCCCGGNEIKQSQDVNTNIFTWAVMN